MQVLLNATAVRLGEIDAVTALSEIPRERVERMQKVIAQHAHTLQYATHDTTALRRDGTRGGDGGGDTYEDAFDVLLRAAYERSQSLELRERGTRLQARDGSATAQRRGG